MFGGEPAIEHPPYDENIQVTYNTESHIDREHTNLAAALRLAQATFPEDSARRVVLLTDGNENVGDGLTQARGLAESGIGIDVVPIRYPPRAEVAVEKVVIPPDVNRGPAVRFAGRAEQRRPRRTLRTAPSKAGSRSSAKRKTMKKCSPNDPVTLEPGKRVFTVREQIDAPDFYTYEARFIPDDAAHDPITQNKRATAYTHVRGKGQVLLIEDQDNRGEFGFLVDRLRHENLEVRVQSTAETFATLADLQPFDTVILANTPAEGFTEEQIKMLVSNTRANGRRADHARRPKQLRRRRLDKHAARSRDAGRFSDQEFESRAGRALAMLMHASEMAEGNFWQKKIAQEAMRALGGQDYCGVLHWEGKYPMALESRADARRARIARRCSRKSTR